MWKAHIHAKQRATRKLARLMEKNHHQMGFDGVKMVGWEDRVRTIRARRIQKMANLLIYRRYQVYFHRWKSALLEMVN